MQVIAVSASILDWVNLSCSSGLYKYIGMWPEIASFTHFCGFYEVNLSQVMLSKR